MNLSSVGELDRYFEKLGLGIWKFSSDLESIMATDQRGVCCKIWKNKDGSLDLNDCAIDLPGIDGTNSWNFDQFLSSYMVYNHFHKGKVCNNPEELDNFLDCPRR